MRKTVVASALTVILVAGLFLIQSAYSQFQGGGVDHDGEWHVGEGLEHGDLFSYRMCHIHYKECADFTMDIWIEGDVQSGSETKWLANAVVRDGPKIVKGFMHLNKVGAEPTAGGSEELTTYSSAFKSSIVWLSPFANAIDPKQFRDIWGSKSGPLRITHIAPKEILPDGLDVAAGHFEEAIMVWGRTLADDSYTYVVDDFPFPIKATAWQHVVEEMPPLEYRFELLAYQKDVTEDPFADVVPTVGRLAGAGCPPISSLETSVKRQTSDSEYLLHVFYAPDIPVSGCPMKWQINFLNKLDETEFLAQVQYDLLVLDEDGKPIRSVARDEGRVFLYSPSGLSTIEMTVREEPGTARYAVWVYGLAPESVVPNGTNTDSLQLEIDVDPPKDAIVLPAWIKTTVGFWTSGVTSDAEFVSAIQFLINERVIIVHPTASESDGAAEVLQWVKTTARFWVDGLTTDREFVDAIQFLIGAGVIVSVAEAGPSPSPYQQVQDGVPIGEILCASARILMQSPSGMPACVFVDSIRPLEARGFVLLGEITSDAFPIRSSGALGSDDLVPPPDISMSRLPNIGETAIVEIKFTQDSLVDITDTEENRANGFYVTGWRVSSGFEVVDSGGVQYETLAYPGTNQTKEYNYVEFTPLDMGESKTYRIEIRAVEDGSNYVSGIGYTYSESNISIYLGDKETLLYEDHVARYPELHERPVRATSDKEPEPTPPTDEEARALEQNHKETTHEDLIESITEYVREEQLSIEWALDNLLLPYGPLNMTETRQILTDVGYTNDEIDGVVSERGSGDH